jgi:1,4-dihydroxy-2-naphthoate octaprenyltransferase
MLWTAAVFGLVGAVVLGIAGVWVVGPWLLPFIAAGVFFVFAYNLEMLRGRVHGDFWFSLSWGAFPVLTAYFAQTGRISLAAVAAASAGSALSYAQRMLSTPARLLRRRSRAVHGALTLNDGSQVVLDKSTLLQPLERALAALSWGIVALSVGLIASRLL